MLFSIFHIAFFLALIALALGAVIIVLAKAYANQNTTLIKIIGWIIVIIAAIHIIGFIYYGFRFWNSGFFDRPFPMMLQNRAMPTQMMPGQMMQNQMPVMQQQNKMMQNQK